MSIEPKTESTEAPPDPQVATLECRIRYVVDSMQKAIDLGVNGFGLELLGESLGDKDKLNDGGVMYNFLFDHKKRPIWIMVVGEAPFVRDVSPDTPAEAEQDKVRAALAALLKTLHPIEGHAKWSMDYCAKSPASHQDFVRQDREDLQAFSDAVDAARKVIAENSPTEAK